MKFVSQFINLTSFKQVFEAIKKDLPRLLGYETVSLFMRSPCGQNLYGISINPELWVNQSFERDFILDESMILKLPTGLGINGFCYSNDAIVYLNACADKIRVGQKFYGKLFKYRTLDVKKEWQEAVG